MRGLGYKNEKIFSMTVDFLILTLVLGVTYLLFGYPHVFPYFQQLEEAGEIINPQEYMEAANQIYARFDRLLLEVLFAWFLYESVFLIVFGTTPGRALFGRKVVCTLQTPNRAVDVLVRCLVFPTRTAVKVMSCYWLVPMLVIGVAFLLSRKDRTLLDILFMTKTVRKNETEQ